MNHRSKALAALALAAVAGASQAAQYDFSGNLANDNGVASIAFSVATPVGSVLLWTDSAGSSFDPVIQLWAMGSASTGTLIAEVDDNATKPTQASTDATLALPVLVPGSYLFTITVSGNYAPASGNYGDGFTAAGQPPTPLPAGFTAYSAHLSVAGAGVSISAVPEPASRALMLLGAAGVMAATARRRRAA